MHPINLQPKFLRHNLRKRAIFWYLASLLVMSMGTIMAARYYPGGFDWLYTVASALASKKHNPMGSTWFSSALIAAMVLLWPYVSALKRGLYPTTSITIKFSVEALRIGLICGALLGVERLLIYDLSSWVNKAHELIGFISFMGLYIGILGLLIQVMLRHRIFTLPVLLILIPLIAIGITHIMLYFDQRNLGWVDTSWRDMGIPIWLSFAFWQWLAMGFLWIGLGLLSFSCIKDDEDIKQ